MNSKKYENIIKMNKSARYDYLVRKVADFEEIYLIFGSHNEMYTEILNGEESILVFPEKEFAQMFVDQNPSGRIKEMDIYKFVEWLDRDSDEKIKIAVFLNDQKDAKIVNSAELKADLAEELEQYQ